MAQCSKKDVHVKLVHILVNGKIIHLDTSNINPSSSALKDDHILYLLVYLPKPAVVCAKSCNTGFSRNSKNIVYIHIMIVP